MFTRFWQVAVIFVIGVGLIARSSADAAELARSLGIGLLASSIVLAIQFERVRELLNFGWVVLGVLIGLILIVVFCF